MNRRFRAGELSLQEVAQNLKPIGNVDRITSPGDGLPPAALGERTLEPTAEAYRRLALDHLHTHIVVECGYDIARATTIYRRVVTTLANQLAANPRAEQDQRR